MQIHVYGLIISVLHSSFFCAPHEVTFMQPKPAQKILFGNLQMETKILFPWLQNQDLFVDIRVLGLILREIV